VEWLFPEMSNKKKDALYQSVDTIKRKYGFHKLEKAASLDLKDDGHQEKFGASSFQKPKIK
jgi:hypothetical protein